MRRRFRKTLGITTLLTGIGISYYGWNISLDVMRERIDRGEPWSVYKIRNFEDLKDEAKYDLSSLVQLMGLSICLSGVSLAGKRYEREDKSSESLI